MMVRVGTSCLASISGSRWGQLQPSGNISLTNAAVLLFKLRLDPQNFSLRFYSFKVSNRNRKQNGAIFKQ